MPYKKTAAALLAVVGLVMLSVAFSSGPDAATRATIQQVGGQCQSGPNGAALFVALSLMTAALAVIVFVPARKGNAHVR